MCRETGIYAPETGLPVRTGRRRTAGILGKGENIDGRKKSFMDGGRSVQQNSRSIKVQSLSGLIRELNTELQTTRVY